MLSFASTRTSPTTAFSPTTPDGWTSTCAAAEFDGSWLVFATQESESSVGVDFNGDGDTGDDVLFAYDTATGSLVNLMLAVDSLNETVFEGGVALFAVDDGHAVSDASRQYVNRLSDLLFVMARSLNQSAGEPDILWQHDKPS